MACPGAAFVLPEGYRDRTGTLHREGNMRPATALEEMRALSDFRVHLRSESLLPVILARVVTRLGGLEGRDLHAGIFERLPDPDIEVLEGLYRSLNGYGEPSGGFGARAAGGPA